MKKTAAILCVLCMLIFLSAEAFAVTIDDSNPTADVTVKTVVADTHKISVAGNNVEIFYNGVDGTEFTVDRLSTPTLLIRPGAGKVVEKVFLCERDVTENVIGGFYKLEPVNKDLVLNVITKDDVILSNVKHTVTGTLLKNGKSLGGVTLLLHSTPKTCVTDANGNFKFEAVEGGHHTLTAIYNNEVIGYMEFELQSGDDVNIDMQDRGAQLISAPDGTLTIDLTLSLNENSHLQFTDIKGIKSVDNIIPQTGDEGHLTLWLALLLLSGIALTATAHKNKRKKSHNK